MISSFINAKCLNEYYQTNKTTGFVETKFGNKYYTPELCHGTRDDSLKKSIR